MLHHRSRKAAAIGRALALALAAVLAVPGCQPKRIVTNDFTPPALDTAEMPSYEQVVARYNENARKLDRLWTRTEVQMAWRTDTGKVRQESGEGRLIFERPLNTAMTVEKFSDVKLWAGSDERGFWVFDLLEEDTAYYGRYDQPLTRPLPLPVRPEMLPYLLGMMPIDPEPRPREPAVENINGYAMIEPPGLGLRLLLEPRTGRPVRIDLTNRYGESALIARLAGQLRVPTDERGWAFLPATADLYPVGRDARLSLSFSNPTTDPDMIQGKWFRFETLVRALKPDKVVDLNAPLSR